MKKKLFYALEEADEDLFRHKLEGCFIVGEDSEFDLVKDLFQEACNSHKVANNQVPRDGCVINAEKGFCFVNITPKGLKIRNEHHKGKIFPFPAYKPLNMLKSRLRSSPLLAPQSNRSK
eukprot:gnl/Chilomastix_cuspidata/7200.p2 GENE.gnl/Chilomastix_cuspidata/7200~~gnl/Chilomastix_cuspidata/7200.p2  ORF type:complete len:128 (-),score=5.69 gnl/Chilomastix_cuspidata/7200:355-711(-)